MFLPVFSKYKQLPPKFIGPLELDSMVNHVSAHLKWPHNIEIHKVFHDSQLKCVFSSPLCPSFRPPPPAESLMGNLPSQLHGLWISDTTGEASMDGRDTVLSPGFHRPQFWIKTWLGSATAGGVCTVMVPQSSLIDFFGSVSLAQLSLCVHGWDLTHLGQSPSWSQWSY